MSRGHMSVWWNVFTAISAAGLVVSGALRASIRAFSGMVCAMPQ